MINELLVYEGNNVNCGYAGGTTVFASKLQNQCLTLAGLGLPKNGKFVLVLVKNTLLRMTRELHSQISDLWTKADSG